MTIKTFIEIEVEVEFDATPYIPAQVSGPPECCYPEEGGEVELNAVNLLSSTCAPLDLINHITSKQAAQIEQECLEHVASLGDDID